MVSTTAPALSLLHVQTAQFNILRPAATVIATKSLATSIPDAAPLPAEAPAPPTIPPPVLREVSFKGEKPRSLSHLLSMGGTRNDAVDMDASDGKSDNGREALRNDREYFTALLDAREKYKQAMQTKLRELQALRARNTQTFKKRKASRGYAAAMAAVAVAAASATNARRSETTVPTLCTGRYHSGATVAPMQSPQEVIEAPVTIICGSPVSTEDEFESQRSEM